MGVAQLQLAVLQYRDLPARIHAEEGRGLVLAVEEVDRPQRRLAADEGEEQADLIGVAGEIQVMEFHLRVPGGYWCLDIRQTSLYISRHAFAFSVGIRPGSDAERFKGAAGSRIMGRSGGFP